MTTSETLALLGKLWELEQIAQTAQTPDGRWSLLQNWIKENPEWAKQIQDWLEMTPSEAADALQTFAARQLRMSSILFNTVIGDAAKERVKNAIAVLQTCYRE